MKSFQTGLQRPWLTKALLVMKLTALLLIVFTLSASAEGFAQEKISFRFKRTAIAGILTHIEKSTHYRFLYNEQLHSIRQKVDLEVEDASLEQTLARLFNGTGLMYLVMQNNLIVIREATTAASREKPITGKITDDNGAPLTGVSVKIKGTERGTTTNEQGIFTINAEESETLVFTYVGYEPQEAKVGTKTSFNVSLISAAKSLENIVVIGYGQVKKRDLTGAVLSVKSDEIKKVPSGNVMESLQGKLPGADISRSSGSASSGVNITIRGNRSLMASNNPLVIVDGIQYNSFQDINPNDIQSLEVLKDASSTAIYGSRGANGVILITTKRGSNGQAKVSANSYYGVSTLSDYPKFMNTQQYQAWRREANRKIDLAGINIGGNWTSPANDGLLFSAEEVKNIGNGVNTDYADLVFHNGTQQEHQVGVSAGSDKTKVYLSLNYFNEKGLMRGDELKRYTGRMNVDQTLGKIAKAGMQMQLTYYDIDARTNPLDEASKVAPWSTPFDSAGKVILSPLSDAARWNPLADEQSGVAMNNTLVTRTLTAAYVELTPFKGLSLRSNLGFVFTDARQGAFYDLNSMLQRGQRTLGSGTASKGRNINWENILTYNKQINDHNITLTGITTFLEITNEYVSAQGNKQILPSQLFYALQNSTENLAITSGYSKENLVSYAGRANYSYKGKYLASVSVRTDGSSKLGAGNKWDVFPAAAVAWRLSDENFLQNARNLSDLKLRLSYGITGSDAITAYRTQSSLTRIPNAFGENAALGFAFSDTIGNPNLRWEKTKAFNLGVDVGFFANRLTATVDFYRTRTTDLLTIRKLPATSGVSATFDNVGSTQTTGIDLSLNAAVIRKTDITLNIGASFYTAKEKIISLVGGIDDPLNKWFIGSPTRVSYDYNKIGIWQMADSTEAKRYNQKPGDIRVEDRGKKDTVISANNDRTVVGQLVPKWNAGLNIDFRYKAFDLNIFLFARMGQTIEYAYYSRVHLPGRENGAVVNYWTPENPTNDFPHPRTSSSFTALPYSSTLMYVDGSFVKIRNITLGYNLPKAFINKYGVSGLRFYVTGKNLIGFSKIDNYDVERGGSINDPLTRLFVAGVNVDF
jgi:TonB-linked SusC/RagA family outer membrane protein